MVAILSEITNTATHEIECRPRVHLKIGLILGSINPHRVLVISKLLWHCGDAVPLSAYRTAIIISCTQFQWLHCSVR